MNHNRITSIKAGTQNIKSDLVVMAKLNIASGVGAVAGDLGLKMVKTKPVPAYSIMRHNIYHKEVIPYS